MADRKGTAPIPRTPADIRNVVLVGPTGSGKTTLMEHLLAAAGAIPRVGSVEEGSTVGDTDPAAVRQHRSVGLSAATMSWDGHVITLVDTPGYADYLGDLRAGLRAADAALFVIGSIDGVDAATQQLWDECEVVGMPRAIVVTKIDKERGDFDETVAVCKRVFTGGGGVLPLTLPLLDDRHAVAGYIDLLTTQVHDYSSGSRVDRACDPEHQVLIDDARAELIEGVITESEDETLMDRFLNGDAIDEGVLVADLERAVARGHFHPVLAHATSPSAVGADLILDLITRGFPSPLEHAPPVATSITGEARPPLTADPDGPLCAEIVKTTTDPYVGKLSIVRVFSGTLRADDTVHVSGHFSQGTGHEDHDVDERVGGLSSPLGAQQRPLDRAIAGSVVAVSRLSRAETGDTLSSPGSPLLMEPWPMPEPLLPIALVAHAAADEDRLGLALARLLAEDPTLRLERHEDTGQAVVWTLGEAHADLVVDRLRARFGVNVDSQELRLGLRETFAGSASGIGRLVKQSGGHGQYAVCEIEVEPLPAGSGFEFVDRVVGGAVPRTYIPSVEKGVRQQMQRGVAAGYPLVDIRVTLVDGKAHSVDSSDMAFQTAGAMALKDAAGRTQIAMLEPMLTLSISVPDEHVGAVLSDLSTRRGHVTGTQSIAGGRSIVAADVPEIEVSRYAIDIRSITHGTGQFTRRPAGYAPMPQAIVRRMLEAKP